MEMNYQHEHGTVHWCKGIKDMQELLVDYIPLDEILDLK